MRLAQSHKLLGLLFLVLLVGAIWGTNAIFTKKFVDYDEVTLQTSKIGLQLPTRADVKIRGVMVRRSLAATLTVARTPAREPSFTCWLILRLGWTASMKPGTRS